MADPAPIRAYAVSSTWFPGHEEVVAAPTAGNAKYRKWLSISDAYEDCPITSMRARLVDGYCEPPGFRRCVEYRKIPFARIGMRVQIGYGPQAREGRIVGHNDSANLDVLIDGQVLNCHPLWQVTYFAADGSVIARYPKEDANG